MAAAGGGLGRRGRLGVLDDILAVCPAAVAPVARALHIRMPMQMGAGRDDIAEASVRLCQRHLACESARLASAQTFSPFAS